MTNPTDPLLANHHASIPSSDPVSARHRRALRQSVAQQQQSLAGNQPRLAQPGDDEGLVDDAVGVAHAAAEVGLELGDGQVVGDQGEGGGGGQAGAVLGEEVEGGRQVGLVRGGRGQVEREEGVVDGRVGFVLRRVLGGGGGGGDGGRSGRVGRGGGRGVFGGFVDAVAVSVWVAG